MHVSYLRKTLNILASTKDKEQRTGDGGTEEQKVMNPSVIQQKTTATEKWSLGQLIGGRKQEGSQGTDQVRQCTEDG